MDSPKAGVVRRFLSFVSDRISLKKAHLATLGGYGLEAKIWTDIGVPSNHGWLIEIDTDLSLKLIGAQSFKYCNRLSSFAQTLKSLHGREAAIDGFHLDLCGTLQGKSIEDFAPVLPLVNKSVGKCLAITVADSRRNVSLEEWPSVLARSQKLFGTNQKLYRTIQSQQKQLPIRKDLPEFMVGFNPAKAAKRELGMMVEVATLFKRYRLTPDAVERHVYVSTYGRTPFRMRTYFFHLRTQGGFDAEVFEKVWLESGLFFGKEGKQKRVKIVSIPHIQRRSIIVMSKLKELAQMIGGETQAEYEALVTARTSLEQVLEYARGGSAKAPIVIAKSANGSVPASRVPRRKWTDLSDQEKIEWLMVVLEHKAKLGGRLTKEVWADLVQNKFGYVNHALRTSCRAGLAQAMGKFRPRFAAKIKEVYGAEAGPYLDRLADLP